MNEVIPLFAVIIFVWLGDTVNAFICTEKGVFANTDSNDCKTFVICDKNLSPTVHNCNGNTYFWPEEKGCFSQYNCATNTMVGNTNPCEGFGNSYIPDKYSADCTTYLSCGLFSIYSDGYILFSHVSIQQCPSETAFRPGYGCTDSHRCVNYQCTTEGLFENPNDCSTFIQCWKYEIYNTNTGVMSFLYPELYNCPQNSYFNPYLKKCDEFYNCDEIDPHSGTDPCFDYNHTDTDPFVPNPYDSAASSYILCQYNFPGFGGAKDIILRKECPAYTFFSHLLGKCYSNYNPSETCSKDPCSSGPGKYVNYKSDLCESYIECRDETTTREVYEPTYEIRYCPPGILYSPETSRCSVEYVCPTFTENYCYPQIPTTTSPTTLPPG